MTVHHQKDLTVLCQVSLDIMPEEREREHYSTVSVTEASVCLYFLNWYQIQLFESGHVRIKALASAILEGKMYTMK